MKTHTGVIHGNIIELSENPGLPDGEEVEIQVTPRRRRQPGEGLRRCAGALAGDWSAMDDQILAELEQDRLNANHRESPQ
ncbi:MAG: hypothetical protein O2856_13065 [Planctomycetota bacterium]|nr:hypothetical protein [Planctomycetota bacterium]